MRPGRSLVPADWSEPDYSLQGTVGAQFDPCYHQPCDTILNIAEHALDVNTDAIAFAVLTFAYSTESVNGVAGRNIPGNLTLPAPAGPEGTFVP